MQGTPVTCVVYTLLLPFAADVARGLGVPAYFFWTMPAAVLSVYHHYFHGRHGLVAAADGARDDPDRRVDVPGLEFLCARDLPSLLTGPTPYLQSFREMFDVVEASAATGANGANPRVLVNTFDALETEAFGSVPGIDLIPLGPMVGDAEDVDGDLFEQDKAGYMQWLDAQPGGSVVYISFGSIAVISANQLEEIRLCLEAIKRPFLWVVRRDNRDGGAGRMVPPTPAAGGMVVEWCSQARVLAHPAVGCFVTHCGWNSTMESVAYGVPMVMAPQWSDQPTNARMVAALWGVGVSAEADTDGTVRGAELKRGVEAVMGDSDEARAIRQRARKWKARATAAVDGDGTLASNLREFMQGIGAAKTEHE